MNTDTFCKAFVVGNLRAMKFRFVSGKNVHYLPGKKIASKTVRDGSRTRHFLPACPSTTFTKRHLAVHDFFHVNITEKRADFFRRSPTRREKGSACVLFSEIRHARVAVSSCGSPIGKKKKKIKIK